MRPAAPFAHLCNLPPRGISEEQDFKTGSGQIVNWSAQSQARLQPCKSCDGRMFKAQHELHSIASLECSSKLAVGT